MRTLGNVLGMLAFGMATMLGFAYLVSAREARPLVGVPPVQGGTPLARLASGARGSVGAARGALEDHRRSDAMHALDAAVRAARVAAEATARPAAAGLDAALASLREAKVAVENGRPGAAIRSLRVAEGALDAAGRSAAAAGSGSGAVPAAVEGTGTRGVRAVRPGATLLDAHGGRIGEVVRVALDGVTVALGPGLDVFGWVDIGGSERTIAPGDLVVGPGGGMVAWPWSSASAATP